MNTTSIKVQIAGKHPSTAEMSISSRPYGSAILLATLSFITMLLILPPVCWHFRNRNIGATALVSWVLILLLCNVVNALLWPSDDFGIWYNGVGLCDIEVKILIASQVGVPASFGCILKGLAAVLDTDNCTLLQTKAQRRRRYAVDLSWCVGFPLLEMFLHWIVQQYRYYIFGIAGCMPGVSDSWLTVLLISVPPVIWVIVDVYYAVLILLRLYRYRVTFSSILASNSTPRSRFMRLYLISIISIVTSIPIQAWNLYQTASREWHPFSWSETHSAEAWSQLIYVRSNGHVPLGRWLPIALGSGIFVFFGVGKEAKDMYKASLVAVGLGRCIPAPREDGRGRIGGMVSSFNSRTKMLFKHKEVLSTSTSTWSGTDAASPTRSFNDPFSPEKEVFPDRPAESKDQVQTRDGVVAGMYDGLKRFLSTTSPIRTFHTSAARKQDGNDVIGLEQLAEQSRAAHSTKNEEEPSQARTEQGHQTEVVVTRHNR